MTEEQEPDVPIFRVDYAVRLGPIVMLAPCPECKHVENIVDPKAVEPALEQAVLLPKVRCKCGAVLQGNKPLVAVISGTNGDRIIELGDG